MLPVVASRLRLPVLALGGLLTALAVLAGWGAAAMTAVTVAAPATRALDRSAQRRELLRATFRAVRRAPLAGGIAGAVTLVAISSSLLDSGFVVTVLRGAAILLALALATSLDEPSATVLAPVPTPLSRRWGARLVVCVPPVAGVGTHPRMERLAVGSPPVARSDRRDGGTRRLRDRRGGGPAHVAGHRRAGVLAAPAVVGGVLAMNLLPIKWALLVGQAWGAPCLAAHLRWSAVLLASVAGIVLAAADPAERIAFRRPRRPA